MAVIEVGRICTKTTGRELGKRCVVVDLIDESFVLVSGPKELTGIRRRRANVRHLSPTNEKVDVEPGADDTRLNEILRSRPGYSSVPETAPKAKKGKPKAEEPVLEAPPAPTVKPKAKPKRTRTEKQAETKEKEKVKEKPAKKRKKET